MSQPDPMVTDGGNDVVAAIGRDDADTNATEMARSAEALRDMTCTL
jgi:hypothetical protein